MRSHGEQAAAARRRPDARCLVCVQSTTWRACCAFCAGANLANIRPDIKQSSVLSYIATAAADTPMGVDWVRLADEAGLTYETAAGICCRRDP